MKLTIEIEVVDGEMRASMTHGVKTCTGYLPESQRTMVLAITDYLEQNEGRRQYGTWRRLAREIARRDGVVNSRTLSSEAGSTLERAQYELSSLCKRGHLRRVGYGKYAIPLPPDGGAE